MKRSLARLVDQTFDVVVIGGGIHGACVAWDAALRGVSVALVEQQDFGHATSANSLKIIHRGLRYVQDGDLRRVRTMIAEAATWRQIAPHLISPLPCLMPTSGHLNRSAAALSAALAITNWLGASRTRTPGATAGFAPGQIISRSECVRALPGLTSPTITGGAVWHDGQIYSSERLLMSVVLAAAEAGATVANYVQATGLLRAQNSVTGIRAKDALSGQAMDIRAKVVVNSTGVWTDSLLNGLRSEPARPLFRPSIAVNLVTRPILTDSAVGLPARLAAGSGIGSGVNPEQTLFIVPWRRYSLIGTIHRHYSGSPEALSVPEALIEELLTAVNRAYPPAALRREDVYHAHAGFLPAEPRHAFPGRVRLIRDGRVHDHWREDSVRGLISVVGVKYTTARKVAEQAVDFAVGQLRRRAGPCLTQRTPVWGGHMEQLADYQAQATARPPLGISRQTMDHLVHSYGSEHGQILEYVEDDPTLGRPLSSTSPLIRAEVVHAVRAEMACTLADVALRRTELGAPGQPDATCLQACADLMAVELGWDRARTNQEIAQVRAAFPAGATIPRALVGVA